MDPSKVVLLGVKGTVLAFNQETGEQLWKQPLKPGMGEPFVTVIADAQRIYAHTGGEIFCLELSSGRILWQDGLTGLGYGIASLAIPGQPVPSAAVIAAIQKTRKESSAAVNSVNH
jgi:outer membrane protein assembly factor BamB